MPIYVLTADQALARQGMRLVNSAHANVPVQVLEVTTTVPNLASLAALSVASATSEAVWVDSLRRVFVADPTVAPAIAGQVVPASDGSGVWRSQSGFSPYAGAWTSQTVWHIDTAGSVEGDGSAGNPISSWAELMSRLNGQQLPPGVTINLHSNLNEYIDARRLIPDPTSGIVITGQPAAVSLVPGATVATYTGESTVAPGEAPKLTSAAIADWTPWLGFRIRFTSGPAAGAYSSVAAVNPGGAGLNVARIPAPIIADYANPSFPVPLAGN